MTDMAQADRTLRTQTSSDEHNDGVFARTRQRLRELDHVALSVNDLTATRLRQCWAIKPRGMCGTCGWIDGVPWTVEYVKHKPAHIPEEK